MDGVPPTYEVQRIQHQATLGTFTLTFNGLTTAPIAYNAPAEGLNSVKAALEALSNITTVSVTKNVSQGVQTWNVTFIDALGSNRPQDVPIIEANSSGLTGDDTEVRINTIVGPVLDGDAVAEVQRIQHSGIGGSFWLYFDSNPANRVNVAFNASALTLETRLETLLACPGCVTVRLLSTRPWSWEITFTDGTADHRPVAMPQLRVDDSGL